MLIQVKPSRQARDPLADPARRHLRKGIAKTALRAKTTGMTEVDASDRRDRETRDG